MTQKEDLVEAAEMIPQLETIGDMQDFTTNLEFRAAVLELVKSSRYDEALALIDKLPESYKANGRMIIASADCKYEKGLDLDALGDYLKYIKLYPGGRGRNYALFGIVVCLKNLDLQIDAKFFLDMIDDDHEGKDKEMIHSSETLKKQAMAKLLIVNYFPSYPHIACRPVK